MSLLKERQKLILLANKSPYGWKTVLEYKHHDLAEDEEDEKKIYRADSRFSKRWLGAAADYIKAKLSSLAVRSDLLKVRFY